MSVSSFMSIVNKQKYARFCWPKYAPVSG